MSEGELFGIEFLLVESLPVGLERLGGHIE